jgi:hypothetical protein
MMGEELREMAYVRIRNSTRIFPVPASDAKSDGWDSVLRQIFKELTFIC